MKLPLPASIKGMVSLIVLLALLPALGLLALTFWLKFRADVDAVEQTAMRSASSIAARQSQFIEDTRLLLLALSRTGEVLNMDAAACQRIFAAIIHQSPLYSSIRLLDAEGRLVASYGRVADKLTPEQLARFREAQRIGVFMVHDSDMKNEASMPVLVCQKPISDQGRIVGALLISASVRVDAREIRSLAARHVEHLHIVNQQGRVLFTYPAEKPDQCSDPGFLESVRERIEALSSYSGIMRLEKGQYVLFEKIGGGISGRPPLVMMLSISTETIYRQMRERLRDTAVVLSLVLCSALLATLYLCNTSLLRPVRHLLQAANRIREGRLDTRVGNEAMPGELRQLALSLDSMSHFLAERDKELTQAGRVANAANQAKTDFLANMSHEIRTPMNAILGMTYLAGQEKLNEQQRGYIDNIQTEAEKLLAIINNILDFSKLEAGKLEIEKIAFALAPLLEEVAASARHEAEGKGLSFTFSREPGLPDFVRADPLHLSQVLHNLLNSVVKAAASGGLSLHCSARGDDPSGPVLEFRIGSKDKLTEMESRLDVTEAGPQAPLLENGSGLSLTIARRLVRLMQGSVRLHDDDEGGGIIFRLPYEKADAADADVPDCFAPKRASSPQDPDLAKEQRDRKEQPEAPGYDGMPLRNTRILLVEDNPVNRQIAEEILRSAGATVDTAGNGFEALGRMENENPAHPYKVVLMDLQMPELDGLTATRRIRMDEKRKNLPIIAMTAHNAEEEWPRCRDAGMNDFVAKPLDVPALLKTVLKWSGKPA